MDLPSLPFGQLTGLFLSALTSATILPGASEAVLAAVLATGSIAPVLAIAVATVGNTLGSVVNWAIGRYLGHWRDHPRFPISQEKYDSYVEGYTTWGFWSLLLSWMPVIGDPITVIAGVLRTPLWVFVPLVGLAKLVRYLLVAGVVSLF